MGPKKYSNASRKPMMCGGEATRKKRQTGTPSGTMGEKADMAGQTAKEKEALIRQRQQLLDRVDDPSLSQEVRDEMRMKIMELDDRLGESATPGRAPVDQ